MPRSQESTSALRESSDGSLFGSPHPPKESMDALREACQKLRPNPTDAQILTTVDPSLLTLPSRSNLTHDAQIPPGINSSLSPLAVLLKQNETPEALSEGTEGTTHPPAPEYPHHMSQPSRQTEPPTLTLPPHPLEAGTTPAASFPDGYPLFPQEMRENVANRNPQYVGNDVTRMVHDRTLVAPIANNLFAVPQRGLQRPHPTHLPPLVIPEQKPLRPSRKNAGVIVTSPGGTQYPSWLTNKERLDRQFYEGVGAYNSNRTPRDGDHSLYLPDNKSKTSTRRYDLVNRGKSGDWTLTYLDLKLQELLPKRQRRSRKKPSLRTKADVTITSPGRTKYSSRLTGEGVLKPEFYKGVGVYKPNGTPRDDDHSLYKKNDYKTAEKRHDLVYRGESSDWTLTYDDPELQQKLLPRRQGPIPPTANDTAPQFFGHT